MIHQRHPFPLPSKTADAIERSSIPAWKRFTQPLYEDKDRFPVALHAVTGWCVHYENMVSALKGLDIDSPDADAAIAGLSGVFKMLAADLHDLVSFAAETLPYDPWIRRNVHKPIREDPLVLEDESAEEKADAVPPHEKNAVEIRSESS